MLKCSCHPLLKVSEAQNPKHTAVIKHYILVWYALVLAVIVKMKIQNFVNVAAILTHIYKTLQEWQMLSSITLNCQVTQIVMNSGSQL